VGAQERMLRFFLEHGILLRDGHFLLTTGGRHSTDFISKEVIFAISRLLDDLSGEMADLVLHDKRILPQVIAGPETGGAKLALWVAWHLAGLMGTDTLRTVTIEQVGRTRVIRRGYRSLVEGKRVLLVDDSVSSGSSLTESREAIHEAQGELVGVVTLANRSGFDLTTITGVPSHSLLTKHLPTYAPGPTCPGCVAGKPLNTEYGRVGK